jgi:hypothetical protein
VCAGAHLRWAQIGPTVANVRRPWGKRLGPRALANSRIPTARPREILISDRGWIADDGAPAASQVAPGIGTVRIGGAVPVPALRLARPLPRGWRRTEWAGSSRSRSDWML